MSLESDLFDAVKALVGNRVYPDAAPFGAARPYITYQQVGGEAANYLESALVGKRNARMQVNCWSDTRLATMALARAAEDALVTSSLRAYVLGAPVSEHEDEMSPPLFGARQDFSIWF